jgi:hypothetical protein
MTMKYMAGIDLHSNNLFCAIVDMEGKRVFEKKLPCEMKSEVQVSVLTIDTNSRKVSIVRTDTCTGPTSGGARPHRVQRRNRAK